MGKTTSLRGVVVDWREVDTVEVRYWETVLGRKKKIKCFNMRKHHIPIAKVSCY